MNRVPSPRTDSHVTKKRLATIERRAQGKAPVLARRVVFFLPDRCWCERWPRRRVSRPGRHTHEQQQRDDYRREGEQRDRPQHQHQGQRETGRATDPPGPVRPEQPAFARGAPHEALMDGPPRQVGRAARAADGPRPRRHNPVGGRAAFGADRGAAGPGPGPDRGEVVAARPAASSRRGGQAGHAVGLFRATAHPPLLSPLAKMLAT